MVDKCPVKVIDNLAKLLIPTNNDDGKSDDGDQAKRRVDRLKESYHIREDGIEQALATFTDNYADELMGVVAKNLTELAKTLNPLEGTEVSETGEECLITGQLSLSTISTPKGYDRMDCKSITVDEEGILTIPLRLSGGNIDPLAISKLMRKLLSADVKKLIVHLTDRHGYEHDFPIIGYQQPVGESSPGQKHYSLTLIPMAIDQLSEAKVI